MDPRAMKNGRYIYYDIWICAYKDGKVDVIGGSMVLDDAVREALWQREKERRILEDFRWRKYEKYLESRVFKHLAGLLMWGDEIEKRISDKHGFDVRFDKDKKACFVSVFDSTGMSNDQLINEVMRRVEAMVEALKLLNNKDMMNEFLVSRGIETVKTRRGRRSH